MSAETLRKVQAMRLIDDIFMRFAFSMCPQSVQVALRIIMDKPDLIVVEVQTQKDLPSILAHSFFLDILAKDANSTYYDIEIQRKDDDAHPRRATTHASATETMLRQKNEKAGRISFQILTLKQRTITDNPFSNINQKIKLWRN